MLSKPKPKTPRERITQWYRSIWYGKVVPLWEISSIFYKQSVIDSFSAK